MKLGDEYFCKTHYKSKTRPKKDKPRRPVVSTHDKVAKIDLEIECLEWEIHRLRGYRERLHKIQVSMGTDLDKLLHQLTLLPMSKDHLAVQKVSFLALNGALHALFPASYVPGLNEQRRVNGSHNDRQSVISAIKYLKNNSRSKHL